ncbi:ammonium transporter [Roseovarius tolerans]|uniref:Ammonium transporter n=1 Tax=Roseovarius tolerans TaxID=74031 RepID=A0A1H8AME0_9RHOB|nr:ammonium transporter [Roseovarius tolerans]SEM71666.1 ammonium transporter [Roseovarius tolerans]
MNMKSFTKKGLASAAMIAVPSLALAQDAAAPGFDEIGPYIMTTLLFCMAGFLVFFMACGFAMLEGGLVRSKNVTMQMTKNIALYSVAAIMYWLIGFNTMYPGDFNGYFAIGGQTVLDAVGVAAADADLGYASIGSDFFFQLVFVAATASIVSGALAERIKLWPFLAFVVVLTGVMYPISGSWQWGGGWLSEAGFSDFAGSTVVHSVGGWAALAGAIVLGPRIGKYSKDGKVIPIPGSNLALATLGTFILWLGWFGFNGGSQLAMGTVGDVSDVSRIFANTNMAAAAGAVTALILTQVLYKKPDLTMVLNGALAGLVSITAEPLAPTLFGALWIGAVGGVIVVFTVPLLDKLKIDDVVGAIPVHLCAGIWGTIAVIFYNSDASLTTQLLGIAAYGVFTFVGSLVLWFILKAVVGIRVGEEEEINGLDMSELGMEAYPEFSKS